MALCVKYMITNKNVVVDVDGVLADFEGFFAQTFGENRRELESLESRYPNQSRAINRFVSDPQTYKYLQPISLGLAVVEYLNDHEWDVSIISSRPQAASWITRRWLLDNGVKFLSFSIHPNKVSKIAEMRPVCAIDDLISVSRHLEPYKVPVLMLQHPWNQFYEYRHRIFSNIQQFMNCFSQLIVER